MENRWGKSAKSVRCYFLGHLKQRADSLEKTLMLGKNEGRSRREQQRMRWLDGINNSTDMSLSKLQEMVRTGKPEVLQSMGPKIRTQLSNWTTIFSGSKITADTDYSRKIKGHLLLERKALTKLDSVLKNRDITLLTTVHIVKALIFPAVMYGCESWTIKKAECQRTDAFELWCRRRLLSSLDCKEIKPINPKGNNPEYSLERLMLKLKPQQSGHLMQTANSLERTLLLGKIVGRKTRGDRGWDDWMASLTPWT